MDRQIRFLTVLSEMAIIPEIETVLHFHSSAMAGIVDSCKRKKLTLCIFQSENCVLRFLVNV